MLDRLEKQFNLPPVLVNICNGFGTEPKMVGQKHIVLAGLHISISNSPKPRHVIVLKPNPSQLDHLIRRYTLAAVYFAALYNPIFSIGSWTGDEEDPYLRQLLIPTIIGITFIDHHHATFGKIKLAPDRNIMPYAIGNRRKCREVSSMVKTDVQLHRGFSPIVIGPEKDSQRQLYQAGIE